MTTNEVARLYDTIMSIPGMSEMVKIDMKVSRKNALLLHRVFQRGLSAKEDEKSCTLLESVPQSTLEELHVIADNFLVKAGLSELSEKLSAFIKK